MKQGHRAELAAASAVERVAYGECGRHRSYATKQAARRAVRKHSDLFRRNAQHCWKCRVGRGVNIFACYGWAQHWHWGHVL